MDVKMEFGIDFKSLSSDAKRAAYMITFRSIVGNLYESKEAIALATALQEEKEAEDMDAFWKSKIEEYGKKLDKVSNKVHDLAEKIREEDDVD